MPLTKAEVDATTKEFVKDLLEITSTTHDTVLDRLIGTVTQRIEDYIDRPLEAAEREEEYTMMPRTNIVFLRAYPLTAQSGIDHVKIALDWDFAAATAVSSSNYHVDLDTGMLHLNYSPISNYLGNNMAGAPNAVQVKYTAGFAANVGALQTSYPAISHACETQVIAEWRRRDDPTGRMTKIGEYSHTVEGPIRMLPDVAEALMPYRRQRFGQ